MEWSYRGNKAPCKVTSESCTAISQVTSVALHTDWWIVHWVVTSWLVVGLFCYQILLSLFLFDGNSCCCCCCCCCRCCSCCFSYFVYHRATHKTTRQHNVVNRMSPQWISWLISFWKITNQPTNQPLTRSTVAIRRKLQQWRYNNQTCGTNSSQKNSSTTK